MGGEWDGEEVRGGERKAVIMEVGQVGDKKGGKSNGKVRRDGLGRCGGEGKERRSK